MKFNEMTYTRPDIGALLARCKELAAKAAAAPDGDALVRLYYEQSEAFAEYNTAANLANIHYTCDTRDAYWKAEQDFFDANGPAVTNASVEISRAFLANPHVDVLTAKFGTTCVAGMKNAVLSMDDRTVELQQQFNALVSRYQQIYGGALVELDGKQLTIPQLGPYKEDLDPAVRRAAYEAEAGYFDAHRAELDELYGEIVKNLNAQARVMGYHDYSELSYVRMNRIGYGPEEIRKFRDQVANDVVPQLQKVMALRAKRTGIARPTFTDLPIMFKDGNPKPIPGYKARMDAARTMYHELSPETAEFIEEGYRRARKYNGIFCVGTQGIEDAYKNDAAQAAYNNADWKILLRQDRKNLEKLIEDGMVNFSPAVKRMLLSLRTERGRFSEMLISSPNGDSVVRHIPDPFSLLMASTNAQDFNECNALLEQGHSTMEALEIMLARRTPQEQLSPRRRKDDY